ncbi:hypothetical protein FLSA109164_03430 [Flavobacterium saliperosum]
MYLEVTSYLLFFNDNTITDNDFHCSLKKKFSHYG